MILNRASVWIILIDEYDEVSESSNCEIFISKFILECEYQDSSSSITYLEDKAFWVGVF